MEAREAAALGAIVEVRDAWCPEHGRVHGDAIRFPFTATPAFLDRVHRCGARGCEWGIEFDAVAAEATADNHWDMTTDEYGRRPYCWVRAVDGVFTLGITDTPDLADVQAGLVPGIAPFRRPVPDRPSGAAEKALA
jgi:hypothetical protein